MRRVAAWEFQDLPGRPGKTQCCNARSVAEALRLLRKGLPISAAGESGSLNCYHDAEGKLRTRTTAPASMLGGHTAVAWLEDVRGAYKLDRCTAVRKEDL